MPIRLRLTLVVAAGTIVLVGLAGLLGPRVLRASLVTAIDEHLAQRSRPTMVVVADPDDSTVDQEDRDDVAVTGTAADRARDAARAAVPGATVRGVERETNDDGTPASAYEVELTRPDGTPVEVELDADYKVLGTDRQDDGPDDDGPTDD